MKRQIEIDDTLDEIVDDTIEAVKNELLNFLKDNPNTNETPDFGNDLDYSGVIHEIVDGNVPIYISEIKDLWYLHKEELEEAYENAGVGSNPLEGNGMSAIYFYIMDQVYEWYRLSADDVFLNWKDNQEVKEEDK